MGIHPELDRTMSEPTFTYKFTHSITIRGNLIPRTSTSMFLDSGRKPEDPVENAEHSRSNQKPCSGGSTAMQLIMEM